MAVAIQRTNGAKYTGRLIETEALGFLYLTYIATGKWARKYNVVTQVHISRNVSISVVLDFIKICLDNSRFLKTCKEI